eukprot:jgi/Astpho2/4082/e_gw1.00063.48.1_t
MVFAGFNWFLIIVSVVIAILALGVGLYLLIIYCHPEDRNQAWFPKAVVIFGIALAIWTVLLFPLDVANRKACSAEIPYSSCNFALPTTALWYFCYIAISVMVFGLCPFAMFYYEGDSDMSFMQRVVSAVMWEGVTLFVVGLVLGICYGIWGYVEYPVMGLASGLAPLTYIDNSTSTPLNYCIRVLSDDIPCTPLQCDAINGKLATEVWTIRVSFFVYVIALVTTAGWLLFMIFAGIGLVALPLDLIREFLGRPRSTISKTEYLAKAKGLGQRAKNIMDSAAKLRKQDREGGKNRSWRREYRLLAQQVVALEEDEKALEVVYPQGTDPDYAWAVFVIMSYVKFIIGLLGVGLSLCWMLQVVLYLFVYPPVTPFLNVLFIKLDNVFPLFGVIAFALFCFWLLACTIKGCTKFGLNFLIFTVHPMKYGATLMSSFLFNVALVLLSCTAAIQFCAQAFSQYANETAIASIFGGQILYLKGLKYLYRLHVFLYSMFAFIGLAALYLSVRGPQKWKRYNIEDVYANT